MEWFHTFYFMIQILIIILIILLGIVEIKFSSSGITQPPVLASILKQITDKNKITKKQKTEIKKFIIKIQKIS